MTTRPSITVPTVISLSGGLDSTVLAAELLHQGCPLLPVFFRYGSKHNPWEERAAQAVAEHYGLALTVFDLRAAFAPFRSALLASDPRPIPQAGYDESTMTQTVVPGRNLIFAAVMAGYAESAGADRIVLATHGGDHHLYPDCRPEFNAALAQAVSLGSSGTVGVAMPFAAMDKTDIVALGLRLKAPFHLTRSCYGEDELSCGTCGTCVERLEAFAVNHSKDPVAYPASLPERPGLAAQ